MIKVIQSNRVCAPQVFCDWCGERIEDARQGNFEWSDAKNDPEQGKVLFAHKRCSRALQAARQITPGTWRTGELMFFPLFLGNNLNLNWEEAWKQLRQRVDFGFAGP